MKEFNDRHAGDHASSLANFAGKKHRLHSRVWKSLSDFHHEIMVTINWIIVNEGRVLKSCIKWFSSWNNGQNNSVNEGETRLIHKWDTIKVEVKHDNDSKSSSWFSNHLMTREPVSRVALSAGSQHTHTYIIVVWFRVDAAPVTLSHTRTHIERLIDTHTLHLLWIICIYSVFLCDAE